MGGQRIQPWAMISSWLIPSLKSVRALKPPIAVFDLDDGGRRHADTLGEVTDRHCAPDPAAANGTGQHRQDRRRLRRDRHRHATIVTQIGIPINYSSNA